MKRIDDEEYKKERKLICDTHTKSNLYLYKSLLLLDGMYINEQKERIKELEIQNEILWKELAK